MGMNGGGGNGSGGISSSSGGGGSRMGGLPPSGGARGDGSSSGMENLKGRAKRRKIKATKQAEELAVAESKSAADTVSQCINITTLKLIFTLRIVMIILK